jgi:hypothetical protein
MRINEDGADEEREMGERFVVGWIEVEVDVEQEPNPTPPSSNVGGEKRASLNDGIGMGTREERSSFGSDATSRTATPTLAQRSDSPPNIWRHGTMNSATTANAPRVRMTSERSCSGSGTSRINKVKKVKIPATNEVKRTKPERQLVAITYSGDWYRLLIPDQGLAQYDGPERRTKCELVEYRRLSVGGGGW